MCFECENLTWGEEIDSRAKTHSAISRALINGSNGIIKDGDIIGLSLYIQGEDGRTAKSRVSFKTDTTKESVITPRDKEISFVAVVNAGAPKGTKLRISIDIPSGWREFTLAEELILTLIVMRKKGAYADVVFIESASADSSVYVAI